MSIEKVREYFRGSGMEDRIREFPVSSATVELAARAVGVEPGRIAKSMSFRLGEDAIVIVMAGDARVDNARYKARFHAKAKMLRFDEAHTLIGHDPAASAPSPCRRGYGHISMSPSGALPRSFRRRAAPTAPLR